MTRHTEHANNCQNYTNGHRCTALATHRFVVDGVPATYAGYTCLEHGEQVCSEYASASEAVGVWTLEPLNEVTQ